MKNEDRAQQPRAANYGAVPRRFVSLRERDAKNATAYDQKQDSRETRIAASVQRATWIIAFATLINVGVAALQWHELDKAYGPIKQQADAAQKSADAAINVARPILSIKNPKITFDGSGGAIATFTIINLGKTAAMLESVAFAVRRWRQKVPSPLVLRNVINSGDDKVLFEREEISLETDAPGLPNEPFTQENAILVGRLFYSDVFGVQRSATFCYGWPIRKTRAYGSELRRIAGDDCNHERIEPSED